MRAIYAPSGSGKTTFLRSMAGSFLPMICIDGDDLCRAGGNFDFKEEDYPTRDGVERAIRSLASMTETDDRLIIIFTASISFAELLDDNFIAVVPRWNCDRPWGVDDVVDKVKLDAVPNNRKFFCFSYANTPALFWRCIRMFLLPEDFSETEGDN